MAFRNKELVDKGFVNIKSGVKTLDLMVAVVEATLILLENNLKKFTIKLKNLNL